MRSRVWFPVGVLFAASVWCVVVLEGRQYAYGPGNYQYLTFNLVLAWIPLVFALLLYWAAKRRHSLPELLALGLAWLVFLPNAPYMVTDFIHLGDTHRAFDSIVLASYAFTALALGFASLLLVQIVVTRSVGAKAGWVVALGAIFLSSVGMYLGRVQRLNSWDVVRRPRLVAWTMRQGLENPFDHHYLFLFVVSAAGFLTLAYVGLYGVAALASTLERPGPAPVLVSKQSWPSGSSSSKR
jgi:uncharacterized membrane protein